MTISAEQFVRAWCQADSLQEVRQFISGELGEEDAVTVQAVKSRANYYRKRGIPLKRMGRFRQKLNIARLAEIVKEVHDAEDSSTENTGHSQDS